jgi:hypothetical protein
MCLCSIDSLSKYCIHVPRRKESLVTELNKFFSFQVITTDVVVALYTTWVFFMYFNVSKKLITSVFRTIELG